MAPAYFLCAFTLGIPLYVGVALEALAFSAFYPRVLALPAEISDVGPRYMGTATGINSLFDQIGAFIGPIIGGYCMTIFGELHGIEVAYYIAIFLFVIAGVLASLFKEPRHAHS